MTTNCEDGTPQRIYYNYNKGTDAWIKSEGCFDMRSEWEHHFRDGDTIIGSSARKNGREEMLPKKPSQSDFSFSGFKREMEKILDTGLQNERMRAVNTEGTMREMKELHKKMQDTLDALSLMANQPVGTAGDNGEQTKITVNLNVSSDVGKMVRDLLTGSQMHHYKEHRWKTAAPEAAIPSACTRCLSQSRRQIGFSEILATPEAIGLIVVFLIWGGFILYGKSHHRSTSTQTDGRNVDYEDWYSDDESEDDRVFEPFDVLNFYSDTRPSHDYDEWYYDWRTEGHDGKRSSGPFDSLDYYTAIPSDFLCIGRGFDFSLNYP
ncbi:hypothetical protein BJ508DRAFT_334642 [Ascobolus immersus RN42]|uniref:Uncharacterized protein n=1 Tax=Ascobolus immersus RN42 TaxID=1160509 RepID=A0A3N4HFB7_ASCIM|nr:hypothetical protein BJ508DRAFT_334642 [Ascobolus immersus RN42]